MTYRRFAMIAPWYLLLSSSICFVSCSSGIGPVGEVSGKVTCEGKVVTEGIVTFQSEQGTGDDALLKSDGTYELKKPLPVGDYKVWIVPPMIKVTDPKTRVEAAEEKPAPDIPAKYRNGGTSDLKAKVEAGKSVQNFDMKR